MNFPLFFFLFFFLLVFSVFPQFKAKETLIFVSFFFSRQALRIGTPMGRLPHGGGPVFRFTSGEVNQPSNFLGFSCIIIEFTYLVLCMIFLTKKSTFFWSFDSDLSFILHVLSHDLDANLENHKGTIFVDFLSFLLEISSRSSSLLFVWFLLRWLILVFVYFLPI